MAFHCLRKRATSMHESNERGETPLHLASQHGHYMLVELLLKLNACPDAPDYADQTPLRCAVAGGHVRVAELLLSYGAKVYVWSDSNDSDSELIDKLPEQDSPKGPLSDAIKLCQTPMIESLLTRYHDNVDGNVPPKEAARIVYAAIASQDKDTFETVLFHEAMARHIENLDATLWKAVLHGNYEAVKSLLAYGAGPDVDLDVCTLLGPNHRIIKYLSKTQMMPSQDFTPLLCAVAHRNLRLVERLLQNGETDPTTIVTVDGTQHGAISLATNEPPMFWSNPVCSDIQKTIRWSLKYEFPGCAPGETCSLSTPCKHHRMYSRQFRQGVRYFEYWLLPRSKRWQGNVLSHEIWRTILSSVSTGWKLHLE